MTTVDKQPHGDYGHHGPGSVHSGYSGAPPPSHQTVVTMTTDPQPGTGSVTEINLNKGDGIPAVNEVSTILPNVGIRSNTNETSDSPISLLEILIGNSNSLSKENNSTNNISSRTIATARRA